MYTNKPINEPRAEVPDKYMYKTTLQPHNNPCHNNPANLVYTYFLIQVKQKWGNW